MGRNVKKVYVGVASEKIIAVTQGNINNGVERNAHRCVIFDAIKVAVPSADHVHVDLQTVRWSDKTTELRYVYLTPKPAQRAIVAFDQGHRDKLRPFRMKLTDGYTKPMAWRHATSRPGPKKGAKGKRKNNFAGYSRVHRKFGVCALGD